MGRNVWTFSTAGITARNVPFNGCVVVPAKLGVATYPQTQWGRDAITSWQKGGETCLGRLRTTEGSGCLTMVMATEQDVSENQHWASCFD